MLSDVLAQRGMCTLLAQFTGQADEILSLNTASLLENAGDGLLDLRVLVVEVDEDSLQSVLE